MRCAVSWDSSGTWLEHYWVSEKLGLCSPYIKPSADAAWCIIENVPDCILIADVCYLRLAGVWVARVRVLHRYLIVIGERASEMNYHHRGAYTHHWPTAPYLIWHLQITIITAPALSRADNAVFTPPFLSATAQFESYMLREVKSACCLFCILSRTRHKVEVWAAFYFLFHCVCACGWPSHGGGCFLPVWRMCKWWKLRSFLF